MPPAAVRFGNCRVHLLLQRLGSTLPHGESCFDTQAPNLALDAVDSCDPLHRLECHRARVVLDDEFAELSARVPRHEWTSWRWPYFSINKNRNPQFFQPWVGVASFGRYSWACGCRVWARDSGPQPTMALVFSPLDIVIVRPRQLPQDRHQRHWRSGAFFSARPRPAVTSVPTARE